MPVVCVILKCFAEQGTVRTTAYFVNFKVLSVVYELGDVANVVISNFVICKKDLLVA